MTEVTNRKIRSAFVPTFPSNAAVFVGDGAKIFLPPGTGYPNYAVGLYHVFDQKNKNKKQVEYIHSPSLIQY